jgi:hypothetical protein
VNTLPERINVIKTVTYHVPSIIQDMNQNNAEWIPQDVDDVLEFIEEWVAEDFGGLSGLVFQDENGNEL